jgi:hypothetical protein
MSKVAVFGVAQGLSQECCGDFRLESYDMNMPIGDGVIISRLILSLMLSDWISDFNEPRLVTETLFECMIAVISTLLASMDGSLRSERQ